MAASKMIRKGRMNFRTLLRFLCTALFINASYIVCAQVYPVQATVQIQPPYSPYLTDYTSPGSQKLVLQLRANDIAISDHPIKLRLTIEGLGITIRTKQNFIPQQLILSGGGIPTILYGEDLLEYFNPNNLDFAGLSRTEFLKTGKLPEGVYRFSIEVFSYNRDAQLSNRATTTAWIILNDPPLLNFPRKDAKVKILDPINIAFTWTPRHTGSPNAAFSTEYIFRLVEIWPENRNPNDAFLSQPALYEETLTQTQIVYGMQHPALLPGRKYAWSVQAHDVDRRDLFKNQGKSEVFVFQFGDALSAPENIKQDANSATTVNLSWELPSQGVMPLQYRIQYRKKGTTDNTWYERLTEQRWVTLPSLQINTTHEVQIRSEAKPQVSEYSALQYIQTSKESTRDYTCGKESSTPLPDFTSSLLLMLRVGDVIAANKFKVVVTEATGQNGTFTGKGVMAVPFFNSASVNVNFSSIQVNANYELVAGEFVTAYNPGSEIARKIEEAHKIGEEKPEVPQTSDSTSTVSTIEFPGVIDSIYFDAENGQIVVIDEEGNTTTYEQMKNEETGNVMETIVVDSAGNQYTVTADGTVIKETGGSGSSFVSTNASKNPVNFKQADDQMFGFDQLVYDAHADTYERENIDGSETLVSWKSVASGSTDMVIAWSEEMENLFDEVNYQSLNGDIPKRENENVVELTVTGMGHEEVSEIEAYVKDPADDSKKVVVGRLNVIGYDRVVRNLVLVPVNGASIPSQASLGVELNKIFSPAIVTWNVSTAGNIEVELGSDGKLDDGSSGLFSNYTQEMREVIRKYKEDNDTQDETYYLFFVGSGEAGTKHGYMPRKKQCGFIFTSAISSQNLAKTVAHELGHGAFRLEHTFETYPSLSNGTTDNVMDNGTGSRLHKYQWDLIHNPVAVWGLFEDDEEGASKSLLNSKYVFMHQQLSTKSYASNVGVNEFTQDGVDYVDSKLYQLDTAKIPTYIYFGYIWFHSGNISRFEELIENSFNHVRDSIKQHLSVKDFNLLAIVNAKYDAALASGLKSVSFRERFFPISGLNVECTKAVNDYLKSGYKKTFVDGLDLALKERADILLNKLKDCKIEEPQRTQFTDINSSAEKAVEDVLTYRDEDDPSCNLCTRAALFNLKNDPVLFPKSGSYVYYTYDEMDPVINGEISGDGSATQIVNDFQDYENNALEKYFVEETKSENETFEQFWKRLQDKADNGDVIIGIYKPKHVFMIVSGGMIAVVNNVDHTTDWELNDEYKTDPRIEEGDKYGFCFATREVEYVPRILECGVNVKSFNAPLYANMDYKGVTNARMVNNLRWFRYIK